MTVAVKDTALVTATATVTVKDGILIGLAVTVTVKNGLLSVKMATVTMSRLMNSHLLRKLFPSPLLRKLFPYTQTPRTDLPACCNLLVSSSARLINESET